MATITEIQQCNNELAQAINKEARLDPQSPYAGKFVGIANGQVVVVSDDLDEVADYLRKTETDLRKAYIVEAGADYSQVEEIWSLR